MFFMDLANAHRRSSREKSARDPLPALAQHYDCKKTRLFIAEIVRDSHDDVEMRKP